MTSIPSSSFSSIQLNDFGTGRLLNFEDPVHRSYYASQLWFSLPLDTITVSGSSLYVASRGENLNIMML